MERRASATVVVLAVLTALLSLAALAAIGWFVMSRSPSEEPDPQPPRAPRDEVAGDRAPPPGAPAPPPPRAPRARFAGARAPPPAAPVNFDARRALGYLEEVCKIGPRVSGSEGMKKQQELLKKHFEAHGAKVELQTFTARQ